MKPPRLTRVQDKAILALRSLGGWRSLREVGCQWRTMHALFKLGLVQRQPEGIIYEYKATPPPHREP